MTGRAAKLPQLFYHGTFTKKYHSICQACRPTGTKRSIHAQTDNSCSGPQRPVSITNCSRNGILPIKLHATRDHTRIAYLERQITGCDLFSTAALQLNGQLVSLAPATTEGGVTQRTTRRGVFELYCNTSESRRSVIAFFCCVCRGKTYDGDSRTVRCQRHSCAVAPLITEL